MAKKKAGQNKISCTAYKNSNQRERNKVKKLNKHLLKFPNDAVAKKAIEVASKAIKGF